MIITELIGTWRNDNYKKPASMDINRKNYDFKSLKELAEWSRTNYFLAFPQKEVSGYRRKEICNELFLGTNLLWLDADYDVDVEDVKDRWEKAELRGFLYFSSRYYSEGIKRLRICVKVRGLTLENALAYAQEVANILNLKEIDKSQYNSTAYYAPVRIVDKNTLQSTTPKFKKIDLWVFKGEILELDVKPEIKTAKSKRKPKNTNTNLEKPKELLSFGQFLDSLDCVESTTVRDNNTVNIIFKHINEKTPNGYFINPYENAWKINHPNDKRIYASEAFKDDFEEYKQYVLDNFSMYKPSSESNPDEIIQTESPYLKPSIFDNNKAELLFIESPTGSGKSTSLSKWLKKHKDKSVLFISVNRAQAMQTHRALIKEGLDFDCYLPTDLKTAQFSKDGGSYYLSDFLVNARSGIVSEKIICGVLSLHHLIKGNKLHRNFDYVIIDEITTLPRASINTVSLVGDNIFRFNQDMTALYYILQKAEKVICLDGFIPSSIIQSIENISGKQKYHIRKEFKTDKRVEIYLTKDSTQPKLNSRITCKKFMTQLDHDIKHSNKNKLLLIALSVKKKAHELYNYINVITNKSKSIELITNRLNNKYDLINFIKYLEKNLRNLYIMIYSPSITTGLDMPQAKGTNVYHLISGKHLSSHIHYQMTMRGRDAKCYKILMPTYLLNAPNTKLFNPEEEMLKKIKYLYELTISKLFNTKSISALLNDNDIGMGIVSASKYLENQNISWTHITDTKILKTHLSKSKAGVYTAIQLEIANIALNNLDKTYSVGQQYLNLLAHEGCKVSVELDTDNKTSVDKLKELKSQFKILKLPVKADKQTSLYTLKNKYLFAQKILHLENGFDKSSNTIINTHEILTKAFKLAKINFNSNNIEIKNNILVKIYNSIYNSINSSNFSNFDKIIMEKFNSNNLDNSVKTRRVTYLLNLFFNTSRKYKDYDFLQIKKNKELHESIQNITVKHKKLLYITDEIAE